MEKELESRSPTHAVGGAPKGRVGLTPRRSRLTLSPSSTLPFFLLCLTGCGLIAAPQRFWAKRFGEREEVATVEMGGPPVDAALLTGEWTRAAYDPKSYVDPAISRWRHQGIDAILNLPPAKRPNLLAALQLPEPPTRAAAAIALARWGDGRGRDVLVQTVEAVELNTSLREAAAEALGYFAKPDPTPSLRRSLDRFCRYEPSRAVNYSPDLHDDLLRSLARHVDPAGDQRFLEALRSPTVAVRHEALAAWGRSSVAELPAAVVDLRADPNPQIRAAAISILLTRKHPQALEYARNALQDFEIDVKIATVGGLGAHGGPEARALLDKLMLHDGEVLRAEAVAAYEQMGEFAAVRAAAGDKAWRVRRAAAATLANHPDHTATGLALSLLDDDSGEVRKATVAALDAWPLNAAGPVLLAGLGEETYETRRLAGEQLARRWPSAQSFSADLPLDRRAATVAQLQQRWDAEFGAIDHAALAATAAPSTGATGLVPGGSTAPPLTDERLDQLQRLVDAAARSASPDQAVTLDAFGPDVVEGLERLVVERGAVLPEMIYAKVLPSKDAAFAALDQLSWSDVNDRRRAAGRLVEAASQAPLRPLATARLVELGVRESDALVWSGLLTAVAGDASQRVGLLAQAGLGHPSPEVRRAACEALGRRARPEDASLLIAALADPHVSVVIEATRALGRPGMLADPAPVVRLTNSGDVNLRLTAARTLHRNGLPDGGAALERLAADVDPEVRRRAAAAMGESVDPAFVPALVRLLDDVLGVRRAAVDGLVRVVGYDVSAPPGEPTPALNDRVAAWRAWYEREAAAGRLPRRA